MPLHYKCTGEYRDTMTYLHITKTVYSMPTAHIKLNREELKAIPLKFRTRQCCLKSSHLFNRVLEVLSKEITQLKETKGIQIGKEELRVNLLSDDIYDCVCVCVSVCVPKISTR